MSLAGMVSMKARFRPSFSVSTVFMITVAIPDSINLRCCPSRRWPEWCARRDSNPHIFRYWNLNPARLPIPPRPRASAPRRGMLGRAYSKDRRGGNRLKANPAFEGVPERRQSCMQQLPPETPTTPAAATPGSPRSPANRAKRRTKTRRTTPGRRRPLAFAPGTDPSPTPISPVGVSDVRSGCARSGHRFEIRQSARVIMRARGIEEDQVEPAVDHRADRPALRHSSSPSRCSKSNWKPLDSRGTAAAAATRS